MKDKMEQNWPSLAKPPVVTAIFQLKFDNGSVKVEDYLKHDNVLKRDFPQRSENIESSLSLGPATKIPLGKAQVSGVTNTRRTGYVYLPLTKKKNYLSRRATLRILQKKLMKVGTCSRRRCLRFLKLWRQSWKMWR